MAKTTKPFSELAAEVRRRPGAAEEIETRKRAILDAMSLSEVRTHREKTQIELAGLMETTQANVSRIENGDNLYLSTLSDYVAGLGGHLEINAVFDDDVVTLASVTGKPS